jgi:predicted SAM-dependent methyltransferase
MAILRINNRINPFRRKLIRKFASQTDILLNIGAGPFGEDDWVNIDMFKFKNISFTYDCRKSLPFKANSVKVIRCEHVLEHMDKKYEAKPFLHECYRVLKPGGIMRIIVPDIEKFVKAYYENKWEIAGINYTPQGEWSGADILTHIFRQGGEHKFGYDFESLEYLLKQTGFEYIKRTDYGLSDSQQLINDQQNHKMHSLYVEVTKSIPL